MKGHLIRLFKEQMAQPSCRNLTLRTLPPDSNRILSSALKRLISFNVQNRPLDEYLLAKFKMFINPFLRSCTFKLSLLFHVKTKDFRQMFEEQTKRTDMVCCDSELLHLLNKSIQLFLLFYQNTKQNKRQFFLFTV